ncbi:MAG: hypothetical protein ACK5BV_08550 [Bacteroidota bacterium]
MQSWHFPDQPIIYSNHLLHNRINLKWQPNTSFSLGAEWRNRMISGDEVRLYQNYLSRLKNPNDKWDASVIWTHTTDIIIVTNTERFWASYKQDRWFIRLGRQRINWSTTTTWNPNDIFNSYNFLDFDYEERPGCDAVQTRYLIHDKSNIELAIAFAGDSGKSISALKYFLQYRDWDLQIISGLFENRFTLGGSWAKSIRRAGWKSEWQYFQQNEAHIFNISSEVDYSFKNKWYVKAGILYNSMGLAKKIQNRDQLQFKMTPLQQMPGAWNLELLGRKEFSPIINANIMMIYSPFTNIVILIPACSINMAENWDADIILQHFFVEEKEWNALQHNGFLRIKWSF